MTLTFPSLPFSRPRLASLRRATKTSPIPETCDSDPARKDRAFALKMMEHCPDALASEQDFHAMMFGLSGRY